LDGQIRAAGLHAPVEVIFDGFGVPSIYARDADDAWFVAGMMHARDRLWQMELYRRVTMGRLSQILGESTLPIDKRFLALGLRAAAEAEWSRAQPQVRTALERYAAGVNAVAGPLSLRQRPLEFQLLGVTPTAWSPVDSLAVGRLLAFRLAENHHAELVRAALTTKLGFEAAQQLAGRYPPDAPTVLGGIATSSDTSSAGTSGTWPGIESATASGASAAIARSAWPSGLEWLSPTARRGNSNNWVVSGKRTKTGRPILANDPHLQIEFPSAWYEMHLVAANLDVIGVTIPGVPFVLLGHNARVAWGMTNTGADVQDLYLERFDVAGKRYFSRGSWQNAEVSAVDIPVRGGRLETFEVWRTPRGAVYAAPGLDWEAPPAWLTPAGREPGEQRAYVLRWDVVSGDVAASFEALNRAADWNSFVAAVDGFSVPSQNIVYADVDGNIGYAMSGRVPVRSGGDGTFPSDGAAGAGEWTGSASPGSSLRVFNPAAGYITSANNEIIRGSSITRDWAAPFRASRLDSELARGQGLDLEAMAALQNDRRSLAAERVMAGLPGAIEEAKRRGADAAASLEALMRLSSWDRIVDDRPVVTLYEIFEQFLWRRAFEDEMDTPLFRVFFEWAGAERWSGLYTILGDRQSRWWDDVGTIDTRESRDDIYLLAAGEADEEMKAVYGADASWGDVHEARFTHPIGNAARPLDWIFSAGPVPVTGDGTTVMRVSFNRLRPYGAWEHPSWRQLFDVGQWDQARVVLPTGQSGHVLSPHRFDQNDRWRQGQYRPQPFSRSAVDAAAAHRLLLTP
jgi:penicillin amidase